MKRQIKNKQDPMAIGAWGLSLAFCGIAGVGFFLSGDGASGLICLGTMLLVSLPLLLERWFSWELNKGFFLFCLLYAMGPMLGKAFKLYYLTNWWDKWLHTSAGFLFAVLGTCMVSRMNRGMDTSLLLQVLFGVFFSISVSALWELVEFGVDRCFGADMQNDAIVHSIHSYLLSDTPGVLYDIPDIQNVSLDGRMLEIGGYLDIGLIDTMMDVLVETVGALVYGVWHLLDRGRHPLVRPVTKPHMA